MDQNILFGHYQTPTIVVFWVLVSDDFQNEMVSYTQTTLQF